MYLSIEISVLSDIIYGLLCNLFSHTICTKKTQHSGHQGHNKEVIDIRLFHKDIPFHCHV